MTLCLSIVVINHINRLWLCMCRSAYLNVYPTHLSNAKKNFAGVLLLSTLREGCIHIGIIFCS